MVFQASLPEYFTRFAGWLVQRAREAKLPLYWCGNRRGAMWGQYVAHTYPDWFTGFILAGGYPKWRGPAEQLKGSRQLIQSAAPVCPKRPRRTLASRRAPRAPLTP